MFLSRTVAAEICMESKVNESAYEALKTLHKEGDLKFDLGCVPFCVVHWYRGSCSQFRRIVVQDLIKVGLVDWRLFHIWSHDRYFCSSSPIPGLSAA